MRELELGLPKRGGNDYELRSAGAVKEELEQGSEQFKTKELLRFRLGR